jgi:hypothetical protein
MGPGVLVAVLAGTLSAATAAADGFAEVAGGGVQTTRDDGAWVTRPKLAVRAGTMDRKWVDEVLSIDWTPIPSETADTSEHRFRGIGSLVFNTRVGALNLAARTGVGLEFLRVKRSSEAHTNIGYVFEVGAGLWFATGSVELGADVALSFGLNSAPTMADDDAAYLSMDLDLLLGVRHVWR